MKREMLKLKLLRVAGVIFLVGFAFLIVPPYAKYCEAGAANDYYCATYKVVVALGDWLNAYGVAITALATIAIGIFTYTLYTTSIEQGRLTNHAIEISRQGLTIAQWPLYYIDEQKFITPVIQPALTVQFMYRAVIHGESPAMLRAIYGELVFATNIPATPPIKKAWRVSHALHKSGFGLDQTISWEGEDIISTASERAKARAAGMWLFAIGCIVYDDLFGNQHEFAFCYRGALGGGWGIRAGGDAYNYHRLRDDAERAQTDMLAIPPAIEPKEPPAPLIAGKDIPA